MDSVAFLQWALPKMGLRWRGFWNVRGQVVKRIKARMRGLGLAGFDAYRTYLEEHVAEWRTLEAMCRVTISRLYRDRAVYQHLERIVLPDRAQAATRRGDRVIRCWSAGCASGEEPYTLTIVWNHRVAARWPEVRLQIVATDIDEAVLERARAGRFGVSSLREFPDDLRRAALVQEGQMWVVREELRDAIRWEQADVRAPRCDRPFDLVLCRNLAFTYFDEAQQRRMQQQLLDVLAEGGRLVIGGHERVPEPTLIPEVPNLPVYVRP